MLIESKSSSRRISFITSTTRISCSSSKDKDPDDADNVVVVAADGCADSALEIKVDATVDPVNSMMMTKIDSCW